MQDKQLL